MLTAVSPTQPGYKAYDCWTTVDMGDFNGLFTEDAFIREVTQHQNMAEVNLSCRLLDACSSGPAVSLGM